MLKRLMRGTNNTIIMEGGQQVSTVTDCLEVIRDKSIDCMYCRVADGVEYDMDTINDLFHIVMDLSVRYLGIYNDGYYNLDELICEVMIELKERKLSAVTKFEQQLALRINKYFKKKQSLVTRIVKFVRGGLL